MEVLQSLTPEPEDLQRLRASEAVLREKVTKLEADLDGNQLQQSVKKLQQAEVGAPALLHILTLPAFTAKSCPMQPA